MCACVLETSRFCVCGRISYIHTRLAVREPPVHCGFGSIDHPPPLLIRSDTKGRKNPCCAARDCQRRLCARRTLPAEIFINPQTLMVNKRHAATHAHHRVRAKQCVMPASRCVYLWCKVCMCIGHDCLGHKLSRPSLWQITSYAPQHRLINCW